MRVIAAVAVLSAFPVALFAAPNRIARDVNNNEVRAIAGNIHRLAAPQFDRGAVDPAMKLDRVMMLIRPSAAQQSALDALLRDQRNPASPGYHRWLTPEEYADRFGLSPADRSKIVAWLTSQGLTVNEAARGRNWVAFSGSAGQISKAFHTSFHRYEVRGETHFANATALSVPAAIAELVGGLLGLDDFNPKPQARVIGPPDFTSGSSHYLAPGDWNAIYNVAPLAAAGYDGAGQAIAVVGQSDIASSEIASFRSDFGLPTNPVRQIVYGADPGFNSAQIEGNLDLEWSGAIAPKATIYYVIAANAFNALTYAVSQDLAPVISVSYAICENDSSPAYRNVAQQANAQGITITAASGDSGGGGCDIQDDIPLAAHGEAIQFPGNLPEVTSMGGTMFAEGSGVYWGKKNALSGASALGYIPEEVWNESDISGLGASGGGPSRFIAKPDWQSGPGVPDDGARDSPDLSVSSAAGHDGYLITYGGSNLYIVGGTSAAAPSMAGLLALLNQYVVDQGIQQTAGLGNINPQLYRMAQTAPAAFHDIAAGGNSVPCVQGGPDCLTGSYGFSAAAGYDLATGLGSIDASVLFSSWNLSASPVVVTVNASPAKLTLNDNVTLTATVAAASGTGTPTGAIHFVCNTLALGSAPLASVGGVQTASLTIPGWLVGTCALAAEYPGDGAFSPGGATFALRVNLPSTPGVSAITATVGGPVFAFQSGNQPPTWQANITLHELAGVPAILTGFTIDGASQDLSQTFPSPNIPAFGTVKANVVLTNLSVPVIKTFGFTGTDLGGNAWSRQAQVTFRASYVESEVNFNLWGSPLTVRQNPAASCAYSQRVTLDETTGYELHLVGLLKGSVDITSTIADVFGTTRLAPWGSLAGTICWNPAVTPSSDVLEAVMTDDFGDEIDQELNVNFAGPPSGSGQLSASPGSLTIAPPPLLVSQGPVTLSVNMTDQTQRWTATIFPANRTTSWLHLSQYAGIGSAAITISASAAGFGPGVYRATVMLESPDTLPQWLAVPVMWVNTPYPGGPAVSSVGNGISFAPGVSPGSIMSIYGAGLAGDTQSASGLPLGYSLAGVSVTVNGWPAPILYVSPSQINVQVPYEAGAGAAVLGVADNGKIGGFQFRISPAAPGVLASNGSIYPAVAVTPGGFATMYVTGAGELNRPLATGAAATAGPVSSLPVPLLPVNVSVEGIPALVQFAGATPGVAGLIQVNFVVPKTVDPGDQPVLITVDGYPAAPVNLTVEPR